MSLEKKWESVFPLDKPFGTNNESFSSVDPWEQSTAKKWLLFLGNNPAAFDSLAILDDIATALFSNGYFHADFLDPKDFPVCWLGREMTVDVEAKAKELAVARLMAELGQQGVR